MNTIQSRITLLESSLAVSMDRWTHGQWLRWKSKLAAQAESDDKAQSIMVDLIKKETKADLRAMVKRVFQACPDVSCDSIASAFSLPVMAVRALSNGLRRGNKVTDYSHDEIYQLATQGEIVW